MPKAPMNEDHATAGGKDQVGIAWKIAAMQRIAEAQPMNHATDRHFGFRVLSATRFITALRSAGVKVSITNR